MRPMEVLAAFSLRQIIDYDRTIRQNEALSIGIGTHLGEAWENLWKSAPNDQSDSINMTEEEAKAFQLAARDKVREMERGIETRKDDIKNRIKISNDGKTVDPIKLPW